MGLNLANVGTQILIEEFIVEFVIQKFCVKRKCTISLEMIFFVFKIGLIKCSFDRAWIICSDQGSFINSKCNHTLTLRLIIAKL